MIKDNIKNAKKYYELSKELQMGLEYLEKTDFSKIQDGRYEILGDDVFVIVQTYIPKSIDEGIFEAHKKYIDIQFIVEGEEQIGVANIENFNDAAPYSEEKDITFFSEDCQSSFINLKANEFAIFTPNDAHMPSILVSSSENNNMGNSYVKKVVVKARQT